MKTQRPAWPLILLSLALAALGTSEVTAQTELYFATGVDSTGRAQAQSNAGGLVLIESPQYPRGLWLHLVDEAGDALAGVQVEYQGRPDSLAAIRCVDPTGGTQETLVWTRPDGTLLRLILKPKKTTDLPAALVSIDWQIDPSAGSLLELEEETRLIGWEGLAAFLRERGQGQAERVAVQFDTSTLAIEVDHPEDIETLVAHLEQVHRTPLEEKTALYAQVLRGGFASLQEGVILYLPLFADANLERLVRERLGRPQGRLTPGDVASLENPYFYDKDIYSLAGIEHLTALQRLDLGSNHISDLTPLKQLTHLQELFLRWNQIADLTPLKQLTHLQELQLYGNQIDDLTPLKQLTNLKRLSLHINQIVDLTPLKQLTNLQELFLHRNQIVDLTPLKQLTNLQELWLHRNQIVDLTPLKQLTNLQVLQLYGNQVVDLTPLKQLTHLQELWLGDNQIVDPTPLKQLTNLKRLSLGGNQIVDPTPLNQLTNLQGLFLHRNQIDDLTPLKQLTNLQELWLGDNQIEDLAPLVANAGLGEGDSVNLQNNPLSDQARNEQIPTLQARGVTVSY